MVDLPLHGTRPETELASQIGCASRTERESTSPARDGSGSEPDPRGPAPTGRHDISDLTKRQYLLRSCRAGVLNTSATHRRLHY